MIRTKVIVVVVMLLGGSLPAAAGFVDGNRLHQDCSGALNFLGGSCGAYFSAVADVLETAPIKDHRACLPNNVTLGQTVDVVKRWLAENPQSRHLAGPEVVAVALERAFPCQNRN